MKVAIATFLSLMLAFSFGCELSQPPASLPTPPAPRSADTEVTPKETDSPFRLLEGYQIHPAPKRDRVA